MVPLVRYWPWALISATVFMFLLVAHEGHLDAIRQKTISSLSVQTVVPESVDHESHDNRLMRIALVNTPFYHYEVVTPLLHSLGNHPHTQLDLYATRYGAARLDILPILEQQVSDKYLAHSGGKLQIHEPYALRTTHEHYHVMVFTSCSRDLEYYDQENFLNPNDAGSPREILCIMHEAHEWGEEISMYREIVQPWIDAGRITFIGLSPHVSQYFNDMAVNNWKITGKTTDVFEDTEYRHHLKTNISTRVVTFPPVFSPKEVKGSKDMQDIKGVEPGFGAIQGKFEADRRNYGAVMDVIANNSYTLYAHHASIRLLGSGGVPPTIPEDLKSLVHLHNGLSYPAYYTLLSRGNAILPAFAHDMYYEDRASSTVAASVIVGTPIIASKQLIEAYAYIERDAAWMKYDNETEVEAWVRVVDLGKAAWDEKKSKVAERRDFLIQANDRLMENMLSMIRKRITRQDTASP